MNSYFCALEQDSLLHITGTDALTFLQGQTTCDTREVEPGQARPGVYCTPQGRVVCDFLLTQLAPDHFALRMRRDIRKASKAVFGKYIIFSKAELDDERDDWRPFAFWGAGAGAALASVFDSVPNERHGCSSGDNFVLVQVDEQGLEFEGYLDLATRPELADMMAQHLECRPESEWQLGQISRAEARIEASTTGEFVPQTLNYDLTGHISFTKGCYTGQEVVARLHYRGTPKRRMYLAELGNATACTAGTPVYNPGNAQSVGNIINAAASQHGQRVLVAATAAGVAAGLHVDSPEGPLLVIAELPYSLATE